MTERISEQRRAAIVERVITEIRDDVRRGVLPYLPDTFSELHSFVDANTYGGMCDENANADVSTEDWYGIQDVVQDWMISESVRGVETLLALHARRPGEAIDDDAVWLELLLPQPEPLDMGDMGDMGDIAA